jgi:hypothetical protein
MPMISHCAPTLSTVTGEVVRAGEMNRCRHIGEMTEY